jgi:hypothetical protein
MDFFKLHIAKLNFIFASTDCKLEASFNLQVTSKVRHNEDANFKC